MTDWDVFNGDADGICSLVQLRLAEPRAEARLVTGVKRDIRLLERVDAGEGDRVTVLDISLAKNRDALDRVLTAGALVTYADHHDPGEPFAHPNLTRDIVTAGEMCTAFIVNRRLGADQTAHGTGWAAAGAFGDNMARMGERLAREAGLNPEPLRELGEMINYNGYGSSLADLHFDPADLYRRMRGYGSPIAAATGDEVARLRDGFDDDLRAADRADVLLETDSVFAAVLPNAPASRRVSGVWGNRLAAAHPDRAHAVLSARADGNGYVVSLRAPLSTRRGAVDLAKQFPTGGGRAAAAGINCLPEEELESFLAAFGNAFSG